MSLIAKSLKRLQKASDKKKNVFLGNVRSLRFTEFPMYLLLVFFVVILFILYSFSIYKMVDSQLKKDFYNEVVRVAREIKNMEVQLEKNTGKKIQGFEYLLESGRLNKLKELAQKNNNIKYLGIYYVETSEPEKGSELLEFYLKKHNDVQARLYLALAFLKEGKYLDALNQLERVKADRYEVFLDKAVVLEKLGDIEKAIKYYRVAYEKTNDPVLKGMIRAKLAVLEFAK